MAVDKDWCLDRAIEITKEYSRGGGPLIPSGVLENVYEQLKKLQADSQS
jgi:hypothetical protein